jgi:hypothetical protein
LNGCCDCVFCGRKIEIPRNGMKRAAAVAIAGQLVIFLIVNPSIGAAHVLLRRGDTFGPQNRHRA